MENAKMELFKDPRAESLSQAPPVLNEVVQDTTNRIRQMPTKALPGIKENASRLQSEVKGALRQITDASTESVIQLKDGVVDSAKAAARKVDDSAHKSPWIFTGATAALAVILGFALGRKASK